MIPPRKTKQPTHTSKIMDALGRMAADFMTTRDLMEATGSNVNQVTAALFHLRKQRVVDVVVETDGTGWWFLTGEDRRTYTVEERTPEGKPRRARRARKVTP